MENENQNMQPAEDRANDAGRDVKRKGKAKRKDEAKVNRKRRLISILLIILLLFGSGGVFDMVVLANQQGQAKNTAKTIYDTLGVDDLYDLIEIKGDEKTGYYYDFVDGTEEKLDQLVKNLQRNGNKAITKNLLKKMIKAEVVNQFPFLQGAGGSSYANGNTAAEKTWNFLVGQGYSEIAVAGAMGNIHQESGGFNVDIVQNGGSGEGIGLCQWSYDRRDNLEAYAASQGKEWTDLEVQLEYLLMELQGGSEYAGDGFNGNSTYRNQWENAETPEEAAIAFEYGFERAGTPMMENRIQWANNYYEQFRGTYQPTEEGDDEGSVEAFLEEAQKVADYVRENHFTYGDAPINPAINHDAKLVSCDRFVGWVLYNIGYTDQPEQQGLTVHVLRDYCIDKGWEEITSVSDLQAGDIVFTNSGGDSYGHTFICAGQGSSADTYLRYDCGMQSRIDSQQPFDEPINGFTIAFRPNLSNSSYLGEFSGTVRIRRVTPNKNIGEVKNTGSGTVTDTTSNVNSSAAGTQIEDYINSNATSGTWSVYAKNLTSNSVKVSVNNQKLESASLIKLFIMATAFEEIEKGDLDKNEVIDDIKIMINRSDNDAANRMIDKLGFDKINNYIVTNGYNSTEIHRKMLEDPINGDNYTSVIDVGNLLEKMYRGTCVTQNASQEMIEILKTQTLTSKIPAGVPSDVETANKTGELNDVENDAAIVYKESAHYVIVVMSNNVSDTVAARNNIKEISSKVYDMINTSSSSQGGTNTNATHKVAIVAGHGVQSNAGTYEQIANKTKWYTTGTSGTTPSGETWKEWQITKKVADYVEQYLYPYSSEVSVVQVGYSQPNWDRMQLAKDQGVDSYVGIHFNSSANNSANRSKCLL